MPKSQFQTAVALFIFNRPETTEQVFSRIREIRPRTLLVVADGPRPTRPGEAERCNAARKIVECVDWDGEVLTNYSDSNLGCKRRVSSGLSWIFETVDEAIILEDDCVPDRSFFPYCEELLARYRHDTRVMTISGNNFQFGRRRTSDSYYFSRYNHVWGWASWRRAWRHYDVDMKLWPEIRNGGWLKDWLEEDRLVAYWSRMFERAYDGSLDTWDYQWTFACWLQGGLAILPNVNLVSNIGFSAEATHTKIETILANLPVDSLQFPLQHPRFVLRDAISDKFTEKLIFNSSLYARFRRLLRRARRTGS